MLAFALALIVPLPLLLLLLLLLLQLRLAMAVHVFCTCRMLAHRSNGCNMLILGNLKQRRDLVQVIHLRGREGREGARKTTAKVYVRKQVRAKSKAVCLVRRQTRRRTPYGLLHRAHLGVHFHIADLAAGGAVAEVLRPVAELGGLRGRLADRAVVPSGGRIDGGSDG